MLRVFGALLLPLCGWLTGDAFQQRMREQLCALEWSIRLLRRIRQEIAFRRADLTQLDAQLQREGLLETPAKPRALQALAPPKALSEAERACFAECMSGLGRTSAEQECERLDYYIARFQEFLQQAQQQAHARAGLPHRGWQPVWCWRSSFSESGRTKRWKLISCSRSRRSASSWRCSTSF